MMARFLRPAIVVAERNNQLQNSANKKESETMSDNDNALVKQKKTIKEHLQSEVFRKQVESALPKHLTPDRFIGVALNAMNRTPELANCTQQSLFKCFLELSQMGLEPDGRRAYLVPFGTECTLLIDYKGLVELAYRNGNISRIHADVVYQTEYDAGDFVYDRGRITTHCKSLKPNRGEVIAAYAEVEFKDGTTKAELMTLEEVNEIRNQSKAKNSEPWTKHWNEMAKKTAFRRCAKWLHLSPEIQKHMESDDSHQFSNMKRVNAPKAARPMFKEIEDKEIADDLVEELIPDGGEA